MSRPGVAFLSTLIVAASLTSQEATHTAAAPGASIEAPSSDSYSAHVATFWKDFAEHAAHLHGIVGVEGKQDEVLEFIRPRINALVPGVPWSFSAGSQPGTHALILSSEGDLDHWLLATEWLRHAPKLAGWEFHAGTPPTPMHGSTLGVGDRELPMGDCRFALTVDDEAKKIGVRVWHPEFARLDDDTRGTIAWLCLSNVLGEQRTMVWLRDFDARKGKAPDDAVACADLLATFDAALREHEWDPAASPLDNWTLYKGPAEVPPKFPRADVGIGRTVHMDLIGAYYDAGGKLADPLAGSGAHYAWIAMPTACFDRKQLVDQRAAIEDAIDAGLDCGRVIGATFGEEEVCIDVVLFDHPRGSAQLTRVLAGVERVKSATLRRFAASNAKVVLK